VEQQQRVMYRTYRTRMPVRGIVALLLSSTLEKN